MSEITGFFSLIARRWLAVAIVWAIGLALLPIAANRLPTYKASADLLIVSEALKDTTLSDPDLPSILTSTEVLGRVIDRLKLQTNPISLAKKIKTRLPGKSSILELTYQDRDGVKAAAVANAIADEATSYFHEIATRGYSDVLQALNERIAASQAHIAVADRLLKRASADNLYGSDKALDDLTSQIETLRVQGGQLGASLAADRATASALAGQPQRISSIVRGEILSKDVVYQQIQSGLAKDVADLVSERASFRDSFPGLANLSRRVHREREQLAFIEATAIRNGAGSSASYTQSVIDGQHAQGLVYADQERLRATNAQIEAEENRLTRVAGAGAGVNTLRAKRDAAVQQYITLSQRLSMAQADAAQGASLGRLVVVSRAIPGSPVLPVQLLAGMVVLVLVLAFGAAYICEAIDRRLWGVREIESVYGRPVVIEVGGHS